MFTPGQRVCAHSGQRAQTAGSHWLFPPRPGFRELLPLDVALLILWAFCTQDSSTAHSWASAGQAGGSLGTECLP